MIDAVGGDVFRSMKRVLVGVVAAGLLLTGCASSRSILYQGVGLMGKRSVITDAAALRDGRTIRETWLRNIASQAQQDPGERFSNVPPAVVRLRLRAAAARYGFTVEQLRFLRPRQLAPFVVVRTRRYLALSRAIPAIERSLDPHSGRSDLTGWAFEGFFLEARDERGVPFVIVRNTVRGQVAGGQWARSEALFPFIHG